jgi:hypothetical protein
VVVALRAFLSSVSRVTTRETRVHGQTIASTQLTDASRSFRASDAPNSTLKKPCKLTLIVDAVPKSLNIYHTGASPFLLFGPTTDSPQPPPLVPIDFVFAAFGCYFKFNSVHEDVSKLERQPPVSVFVLP